MLIIAEAVDAVKGRDEVFLGYCIINQKGTNRNKGLRINLIALSERAVKK